MRRNRWLFIVIVSVPIAVAMGSVQEGAVAQAEETRNIPLESSYSTSGQKGLRLVGSGYFLQDDGTKKYLEPCGSELEAISREAGSVGASNVFLVRGNDIAGAVRATRWVFTGGRSADVSTLADAEAKQAPVWAVVYFGRAPSEPPVWLIRAVELKAKTMRVTFLKRQGDVRESQQYFAWIPLGNVEPGVYTLELFDAEKKDAVLVRRVTIPEK